VVADEKAQVDSVPTEKRIGAGLWVRLCLF